jgi:AraC-like DNA-binding protein
MDSLAGLLDGPRARGAFVLQAMLDPPWSMRIADDAPLTLIAVTRGSGVVVLDDGAELPLGRGDVMIVRGNQHYSVADSAGTPPQVVILPGGECAAPDGSDVKGLTDLGVRTWGNSLDGETTMLVGTYQLDSEVSQRLLAALPSVIHLPATDTAMDQVSPLVHYLQTELTRDEPGQESVLDRLLDLMLIAVLRTWFARPEAQAPGWYAAHSDPVVGPALQLMHHHPDRPWTIELLAREAGVSRAALARRFNERVGQPPMAFLTEWRLTLAADLLREPGATVGAVAHQVGYSSAFALSAAFKRVRGVSPTRFRATA